MQWRQKCAQAATASLAIVALVVGCAGAETRNPPEYTPRYAVQVIGAAYGYVRNRYIETVSLREFTLDGLDGLRTIDPEFVAVDRGDAIDVFVGTELAGHLSPPAGSDPDEWAAVTVAAIEASRGRSARLRDSSSEALFEALLESALSELDPFSRYSGADEASDARAVRDGFGGVGITVQMQDAAALVVSVVASGPAQLAGLEPDDRITHIDGIPVVGWDQRQLIRTIRGPVGAPIRLSINRPAGSQNFVTDVRRQHIVLPTVEAELRDGTLVVQVKSFNQNTSHAVARAVVNSREYGRALDGVIMDLRGNPGGLLDQAVEVADAFLDKGEIVETRGRHPHSLQRFLASDTDLAEGAPLVVLVNGSSASGSEVVAAALQDQGRAVLIGTNSYGKGTVQTVMRLPNNGELTLTWSRLHAPSGYILHGLGVMPSVCTHGGGAEVGHVPGLLDQLNDGAGSLGALARWRTVTRPNDAEVSMLRQACSSDNRAPDLDIELAQALIANPALYESALSAAAIAIANR